MLLSWCAVSALSAVLLVVLAAVQPQHLVLRIVQGVLLVLGEVLPFVLLPLSWWQTRFVIPFLGPPIRIGMLPVWWALAAVVMAYVAAALDTTRSHSPWWLVFLPPVHAIRLLMHRVTT